MRRLIAVLSLALFVGTVAGCAHHSPKVDKSNSQLSKKGYDHYQAKSD